MSEDNPTPSAKDGTLVQSPADAARILAGASGSVGVPGFQIEGTLGRGGMGVVYKATQTGLNRVVALKMLIAGQYADPSSRARFFLEAEYVAALEHPHIIRVFAFGESSGHPYLAMEYAPGGTLADRVKANGPLPANEATELLSKLAAAVAHAHSRGVVHRDIKPLNVLMTADGEPRLTDFGLAKVGRAEQNLSVTGQVLGTPAYMSPEQAAGKVHEVGTAADVYALGAVLYDLLTGRPPFAGDSVAVTLQKVISEEPQRPRKLNASIPRDLETICLKCLEKTPAKRYPTAQSLADDLLRYSRGEPISVRPAGALERGYKWVKRNKVVAGAMTAVSLALLVGTGVSLGFGLEANKQANEARKQKKEADDATEREKGETARANRERDAANRNLATALVGPIVADKPGTPLTPYELETFWQIAELRHDEVRLMFLEAATKSPSTWKQLECRAEYVLHAAIGLDINRRNAVEQLLLATLQRDPNRPQHLSLARAASYWGNASPALAAAAAKPLIAALAKERNLDRCEKLANELSAVATRMEPTEAAKTLLAALEKEKNSNTRKHLAENLSAVAAHMAPVEAAKACAEAAKTLLTALEKEPIAFCRRELAKGLSAVATRMEPAEAASVCARAAKTLLAALNKENKESEWPERVALAQGLSAVAARMEPIEGAETLLTALKQERVSFVSEVLVKSLSAVTARLEPPTEAAKPLLAALKTEQKGIDVYMQLVSGLAAVAARVEPTEGAKTLLTALEEEKEFYARAQLAKRLPVVAARMEPSQGAKTLFLALEKEENTEIRGHLAEGLAAVAARMEPVEAARVCARAAEILLAALEKEPYAGKGLSALAACMVPTERAKVCDQAAKILLAALNKETNLEERGRLAEDLAVVAASMVLTERARVCDQAAKILLAALEGRYDITREALAKGLSAVAARTEPPSEGAKILLAVLEKEKEPDTDLALAKGLLAVVARMGPTEGAKTLLTALEKVNSSACSMVLAEGLSVVASRMESTEAAEVVCSRTAKTLLARLESLGDEVPNVYLVKGLAAVAAHMEPTEILLTILLTALEKVPDEDVRRYLARSLTAVAARAKPTEGIKLLFVALAKADSGTHRYLAVGLSAVALGLPIDARERSQHTTTLAVGSFATPHNVLPSLPLLHPHFQPQPRPLPAQTLVELLKHPFCVGEARRAILDALEFTYNRAFADQWEFVEYAGKHQPQLDLLTPPKRPQP